MLRRVKIDVIAEMTKKKEEIVPCKLSSRQQVFYQAIKNKISLNELLDGSRGNLNDKKLLSLMNIVMQLRKVLSLFTCLLCSLFFIKCLLLLYIPPAYNNQMIFFHITFRSAIIRSYLSATREVPLFTLPISQMVFFLPHLGNCKMYIMLAREIL